VWYHGSLYLYHFTYLILAYLDMLTTAAERETERKREGQRDYARISRHADHSS
jgi:hypothetical protein